MPSSFDTQTPFEILGVPRNASAADVRRAYLNLARRHHPDKCPPAERPAAEVRFRAIGEAYEVLSDPTRRAQWEAQERRGVASAGRTGDWGQRTAFHDPFDLFEALLAQRQADMLSFHRPAPSPFASSSFSRTSATRGDTLGDPFFHDLFDDPFFRNDPFDSFFGRPPSAAAPARRSPFGMFGGMLDGMRAMHQGAMALPQGSTGSSWSFSSVNGVRESKQTTWNRDGSSITRRTDSSGRVTETHKDPAGRVIQTLIDGQPSHAALEDAPRSNSSRIRHAPLVYEAAPAEPAYYEAPSSRRRQERGYAAPHEPEWDHPGLERMSQRQWGG